MARAIKTATLTYGSSSYDIESIPVGVPEERETFDITAFGDTIKKFFCSNCKELGEFDIEVLKVGTIATSDTASALSISVTDEDGSSVSLSFGDCYLVAVKPGSASTSDRKATQTLTFRPKGGTVQQGGGN